MRKESVTVPVAQTEVVVTDIHSVTEDVQAAPT